MRGQMMVADEIIMSKILLIRNQKVMIDADLAKLFGVTTKQLNQQVKRNINRLAELFMFQLTEVEKQEVVTNCDHLKKLKFSTTLPYVFTEHGTIMLGSVLNSEQAVNFSVKIVESFIKMREYLNNDLNIKLEFEDIKRNYLSNQKH